MAQQKIALITDSACDLSDDVIQQNDILMVPLHVLWAGEDLRDRVDITAEQFYRRLPTDPTHPTTSQPHPHEFAAAIQQAQDAGAEEVVLITISSGMSSTYNSALQAMPLVNIPVHVVDSKANSMSQGWQVLAAARARQAGGGVQEMIAAADRVRQQTVTLLYLDTLEYLHRGGRIGVAAWWIGTVLNLKPQLYVDHNTGTIQPGARARSRSKGLDMMVRTFFNTIDTRRPLHVAVMHGDCLDDTLQIADRIKQEYFPVELVIGMTSPVMGVHTGPGALALCGYAGE